MKEKVVCVLGMHRSGSSYVTGRIRGMGIDLGNDDELIGGDTYNEHGYHENKDLSYLGEKILAALGGDHLCPPLFESGWEKSSVLDSFRVKAKNLIDKKFAKSTAWGWKDPRNSLLLPFWKEIVDPTHYIITIRNPLEVAESLLRRNGIAIRHGSELWFLYVASAISHTQGFKRKFVFFDDACQSPLQVDKELREFLSVNYSNVTPNSSNELKFDDFLVHHKQTDEQVYTNTDIHPLTKALYRALREMADFKRDDIEPLYLVTDKPSYRGLSLLNIVEAELPVLCNPWTLPNLFQNSNPILQPNKIEHLNLLIQERDKQLASLNEALTERSNYIHDLISTNEQLQHEARSLFLRLENILQSNSWKLTRPLRGLARLSRHRIPIRSSKQHIYQLGRLIGKKLPIPLSVKIRCRNVLLRFAYSADDFSHLKSSITSSFHDGQKRKKPRVSGDLIAAIRPECCALERELVSIILPVFNQANLLAESIESVLAQTYKKFELIIVNDGSTDNVEAVLDRYIDHPKIRIYSQPNQKLSRALSNGFSNAYGEYWTWTSADNIMEPQMVELMVKKLESDPMTGMVYADYLAIDDNGEILKDCTWRAHNRPRPSTGEIRLPRSTATLNTVQDNFIGPCFMYRGWIGKCLGEYESQLGVEDYDYWMRINTFFPINHLGEKACLYRYRVHDNTLSAKAHEHGIHEKLRDLMAYEKKRAELYKAPTMYIADDVGFSWLVSHGFDQRQISRIEDVDHLSVQKSALIIIAINTLPKYIDRVSHAESSIAIILDDQTADYVQLNRLRATNALALVYDHRSAARVRLVSDLPTLDAASAQTHGAVVAFVKNRFAESSIQKNENGHRLAPERLFSRIGRKSRVMLQVDNFIQGGLENVVIDLALSLRQLGINAPIAILGKEGDAGVKARQQGLEVISFGRSPTKAAYEGYLKQNDIGLVNAHFSIYGAELCAALDIPFLQTIHNSYVWFEPQLTAKYQWADAYTTAYICVSATAARYADAVLGLDVSKMVVIPNGIDPSTNDNDGFKNSRETLRNSWQVDSQSPVFLNVASIMAPKAQLPLVNAFCEVLKIMPNAYLVLLGNVMESAYEREVTRQIAALGIQNRVILPGYDKNVANFYQAADVFVLPSYWEGWSLSLGEAVANGLPCVITDVGSAYEFYENGNVEIIQPPFADITLLNYLNLAQYVYQQDFEFEKRLANAMVKASSKTRYEIGDDLRKKLARQTAYREYALLFSKFQHRKEARNLPGELQSKEFA